MKYFSECFPSFLFETPGGMFSGGGSAALLLPRGVLLDVSGRCAAIPHGGAGLQHHSETCISNGRRLWNPGSDCYHISRHQLWRIWNSALVSLQYMFFFWFWPISMYHICIVLVCICTTDKKPSFPNQINSNGLSTLLRILQLTDALDWLVMLWLTRNRAWAPPTQRAELIYTL